MSGAVTQPAPADSCACGHVRNHHSGYGLGRCLAIGCSARCERLTDPHALEHKGPASMVETDGTTVRVTTGTVYGPPGKAWPWRPGALDEPVTR